MRKNKSAKLLHIINAMPKICGYIKGIIIVDPLIDFSNLPRHLKMNHAPLKTGHVNDK